MDDYGPASAGAIGREATPLETATKRVEHLCDRIQRVASQVDEQADMLLGQQPAPISTTAQQDANIKSPTSMSCGGQLGQLISALERAENVIDNLEIAQNRMRPLL